MLLRANLALIAGQPTTITIAPGIGSRSSVFGPHRQQRTGQPRAIMPCSSRHASRRSGCCSARPTRLLVDAEMLGDRVHVQEPKDQQRDSDHADQSKHHQDKGPNPVRREAPLAIWQPPTRREHRKRLGGHLHGNTTRRLASLPSRSASAPPRLRSRESVDENQPRREVARPLPLQDSQQRERSRSTAPLSLSVGFETRFVPCPSGCRRMTARSPFRRVAD